MTAVPTPAGGACILHAQPEDPDRCPWCDCTSTSICRMHAEANAEWEASHGARPQLGLSDPEPVPGEA